MKIYVPGFPVKLVDEPAEPTEQAPAASPLPDVAQAMALAQARQSQVLSYTRETPAPSPLVENPQPGDPVRVASAEDLGLTVSGQPHSVNDKPEVT